MIMPFWWQGVLILPLAVSAGAFVHTTSYFGKGFHRPLSQQSRRRPFSSVGQSSIEGGRGAGADHHHHILSGGGDAAKSFYNPTGENVKGLSGVGGRVGGMTGGEELSRSLYTSAGPAKRPPRQQKEGEHVIVFIRHGQTEFNLYDIFTGWCDVDINTQGEMECRKAGMLLATLGYEFDLAYTSVLRVSHSSCSLLLLM